MLALDACADTDQLIVVVCDRCTDTTATAAQAILGRRGTVIEGAWSTVGEVRAAGSAAALASTARPPAQVWLANTDADTVVSKRWVIAQLALAAQGWAAVAGVVKLLDPPPQLAERFNAMYTIAADGSHLHVHGANLGVRGDAYLSVGGWPSRAIAEDHALIDQFQAQRWPVISTEAVNVHTSPRLHGRISDGFAATLRHLPDNTALGTT